MSDYFELISQTEPKARKNYNCDGFDEILRMVETKKDLDGHKCSEIRKADKHICQVNKMDGEIYNWRSCYKCFQFMEENDGLW